MKLQVRVIEARNLPAMDLNGFSDPYVRLQLGKHRSRTKVVKKNLNPKWGDDFTFRVDDLKDELVVSVLDEDKYFNDDFVGQVRVPVSQVFDAENQSLGSVWYPLLPKKKGSKKDCGDILLGIWFSQKNSVVDLNSSADQRSSDVGMETSADPSTCASPCRSEDAASSSKDSQKSLAGRIAQIFQKNADASAAPTPSISRSIDASEPSSEMSRSIFSLELSEDESSLASFDEVMKAMESRDQEVETPSNLPGGILVDQLFMITPSDLNTVLFAPDSSFYTSLTELQGTTEVQITPWKLENEGESAKRVVSYLKAATKLIKAVKGTEEQAYLKADGEVYSVLAIVSTPDVPFGSTFKVEVLYCISPGPELPSGEQCSRLVISWRLNFLQSTMMKGMIENGARQGLKDSFEQYATLLAQNVKPVDSKDIGVNKDQALSSLHAEPQSDWKLAVQYFANFTVFSTFLIGVYVFVHIMLSLPSAIQGLEFSGLDLPDSIGEFVVSGVLVLQCERVLQLISRFMQARKQKGSDHGVKAHGDGWLLTVALIEGVDLAAVDPSGHCDPYIVFTSNGKTRTSSIKFQKSHPLWNEIFEFDAMADPPSVLNIEVYDFDGPFDEAVSLGHAEACQSKLHLRIFLDHTGGGDVVRDYLTKMEKEVGKKINVRSPQTNSAFQKLFGLPQEEFLINDFTCHLKRKMPLQGRLFLSARIVGFYASLFGNKTKFFFLWEDIEDIQVLPPTLASMGSPTVVMTLRPNRGTDARIGAKTHDEEGRLKFHFHSFVSFNVAQKTIMALWKAKSLTPEQKVQAVEEESEQKLHSEECGSFLGIDDVRFSEVYSLTLSVPVSFFMELFGGGEVDRKAMERACCQSYSCSPWESEKADVYERQTYYRDKRISRYRGEVTSTQQKTLVPDKNGWLVEEVMTLHGVPLGDYFNLHLRYQIEEVASKPNTTYVRVYFGIEWLKSSRHQKRVTKNILVNLQDRLKMVFGFLEKEYSSRQQQQVA
ncbi:PREDICTED: C2 and GRAM domain-containing protein At1g03370 isoform X2 [Brassica oleracea var. oleracea]|uniref:C2 and GRAM domain-containing protein At1g03370 isoform X2 n=1 Tax=Brassica oleracea var. oleracea TaxID=109376 RepID=UPI0006A70B79|nr:PREDICTED: C2 and GRAM domain-containing protein At1g03370 isoform X2 [Brassica oleracea var. oleracea]